jgi:hypothetical protein
MNLTFLLTLQDKVWFRMAKMPTEQVPVYRQIPSPIRGWEFLHFPPDGVTGTGHGPQDGG